MKDIEYYMELNYKVEIIKDKEEGGYILQYPELKGCITCADTIEEGIELLKDAKKSWLESALQDGISIPEPLEEENFSGQFKLRMPKSLHKELMEKSKEEGISMNQYCLYLLSKGSSVQSKR
ncbi:putative RNase H-like HicB family nuclease [Clostridium algifaecis]|uniref:RNase H-like HicB family nuclease n=1 Tax=Clostridium algifaecis TaxID=1472040 RepID=A0ABS4KRA1_9CLOT|nr:type II toxin-antitoxin system HicB family antitoxin [Clostridium algifaecis]MBP2032568.1 putative RNase H-like HicB family nuclease [Clostridium algifaecis]